MTAPQSGLFIIEHRQTLKPVSVPFGVNDIKSISAGKFTHEHFIILTKNGNCFAYGRNGYNQLGLPEREYKSFTLIPVPEPVQQVATAYDCTLFLSTTGNVYFTGTLENLKQEIPTLISCIPTIIKVAAGKTVCTILTNEKYKNWMSFGSNNVLELGVAGASTRAQPKHVPFGSKVTAIDVVCGECHTILLTNNGELIGYGWNGYGQMGKKASQSHAIDKLPVPFKVASLYSSGSYTMALSTTGKLYAAGWNDRGNCGIGETREKVQKFTPVENVAEGEVKHVFLEFDTSYILKRDGRVYYSGSRSKEVRPTLLVNQSLEEMRKNSCLEVLLLAAITSSIMIVVGMPFIDGIFKNKSLAVIQRTFAVFADLVVV